MAVKSNSTMSEIAYQKIKEKILNTSYAPRESLAEGELAKDLEMSRQPIRIALHRLHDEGLLSDNYRHNIRVSDLNQEDVREVFAVRSLLEINALLEIFKQDKSWEYSFSLEEIILKMRAEAKNQARHEQLDLDFHTYLINIYNNSRIEKFYNSIRDSIYRINMLVKYEIKNIEANIEELLSLVLAIREKDQKLAQEIYQKHLQDGLEIVLEKFAAPDFLNGSDKNA